MKLRSYLCGGLLLGSLAAFAACRLSPQGALTADGYQSRGPAYRVVKTGASFLDEGWMLDNYYMNQRGAFVPKDSGIYRTSFLLDGDGDGKFEETQEALTYDLRFRHRRHAAFIWVRSIPVSDDLREKDLHVLMKDYVDEIAGAGYEAVQLSGAHTVVEKRYAAEIIRQSEAKLASRDAFYALIDVANIDQIKLTPSTRHMRVELVFTRPGTDYVFPTRQREITRPALLMAGYANFPEDFDADEPAFRRLLGEIEIGAQRGFSMPSVSPSAAAAPTSASAGLSAVAPPASASASAAAPLQGPAPPPR